MPRAWTHLLSIVAGEPLDPVTPIPQAWQNEMGRGAPATMTDGVDIEFEPFEDGFNPADRLDQAILATQRAVFPELGLHPEL